MSNRDTSIAIGSIASHRYRLGANCFFASARSPARSASVNLRASTCSAATCRITYER